MARIGSQWFVIYGRRRDPDLTDAFRRAIRRKALSTQRKVALFFERFFNFECFEGEPHDAFVAERIHIACERIEAFLEALGFEVIEGDREDEAMLVKIGDAGSMSALACQLKALGKFYRRLAVKLLRPKANPGKIDNWHTMSPEARRDMKESLGSNLAEHHNYAGSRYVITDAPSYAVRMEDALGLGALVLAAGRAFGWPPAIYDQVTVMDDDGGRWVDTYDLTAADWALASRYGRTLMAPNKGSDGVRVKKIMVTLETVAQLKQSFDDDPDRPDFAELERLLAARDWKALEAIPLFPSRQGRPYCYHTFNNDYFRPAMEAGDVTIRSETSISRATAHRLRHARIQEEADHIYRPNRTDREIEVDEDNLRGDVSIKSKSALKRYVGPLKEKRSELMKVTRSDARQARKKGDVASSPDTETMSATERRLAELS
ncbi:hypothetical protein [Sphingomonas faeni]|uniref:hypothetical protein n=1 Tax=Sphingomonas faeni TaxID=185950 RepID=UPI0033476EF0